MVLRYFLRSSVGFCWVYDIFDDSMLAFDSFMQMLMVPLVLMVLCQFCGFYVGFDGLLPIFDGAMLVIEGWM